MKSLTEWYTSQPYLSSCHFFFSPEVKSGEVFTNLPKKHCHWQVWQMVAALCKLIFLLVCLLREKLSCFNLRFCGFLILFRWKIMSALENCNNMGSWVCEEMSLKYDKVMVSISGIELWWSCRRSRPGCDIVCLLALGLFFGLFCLFYD